MFDNWAPTRYERMLYEGGGSEEQRALLAGISRAIRMSHATRDARDMEVAGTATGLVAPLVFFYTWWMIRSAMASGIRRIYFMARDGQIFMRAAQVLVRSWNLDIEVCYLYCSRESLLLPSFERMEDFELNWITWGYLSTITAAEISRRLGLTPEELRPFLEAGGLNRYASHPGRPIAREDMPVLQGVLREETLADAVRAKARPLFDLTIAYLDQEGLCDGMPFALADTGWRGSSQYAVSALMHKGKIRPAGGISGYYVGLNCDVHQYGNDMLQAFLFDWRHTPRDYRLYYFICFEMLFSADHGRTLGYRQERNVIVPILGNAPDDVIRNLVGIHHDYVEEYVRRASGAMGFDSFDEALADVARRLSRSFICSPSKWEAAIYGDWPIASEIGEGDFQSMAPPMGLGQFVRCALGKERVRGFWPQASLIRNSQGLACRAYNLFLDLGALDWYRRFLLRY
ncbi:MAG TPA: hypothetical protein VI298_12065 [Geobacteraceae bacterium]